MVAFGAWWHLHGCRVRLPDAVAWTGTLHLQLNHHEVRRDHGVKRITSQIVDDGIQTSTFC